MGRSDEDPREGWCGVRAAGGEGTPPGRGGISGEMLEGQNQLATLLVQGEGGCHSSVNQQDLSGTTVPTTQARLWEFLDEK